MYEEDKSCSVLELADIIIKTKTSDPKNNNVCLFESGSDKLKIRGFCTEQG